MTRPTAAPAYFPYRDHRTMAGVMRDEKRAPARLDRFFNAHTVTTRGAE